jgi:hypothetical protein
LPFHGDRLNYCRCHCTHHNYTWWGCFIPPPQWCSSDIIGAPQSSSALLSFEWRFNISFSAAYCLLSRHSSIPSLTSNRSASISFQTCYLSPLSALLTMDGLLRWICAPQSPSALLCLHFRPLISFCAPPSPSALPLPTSNSTSGTPPFLVVHLVFPPNSSYLPFKLHFDSPLANLNSNLLDITNRAKRHWNSISPTRQAGIIRKYKERLQLLCAVDELCVPAFVGPDEMGDLVDDIETMFDCIPIA